MAHQFLRVLLNDRDVAHHRSRSQDFTGALVHKDVVLKVLCSLLLLELAQGPHSMRDELEGCSWRADLMGVTQHLVRAEVHDELADLSAPAKLLQNCLASDESTPRASEAY